MKRERQLPVMDCTRTTRAIANAQGKIVFSYQEEMKKPRQNGREGDIRRQRDADRTH